MSQKVPESKDVRNLAQIDFPSTDRKIVVADYSAEWGTGTVSARVTATDAETTRVIAVVRDLGYDEPMPPTISLALQAGYTELAKQGATLVFKASAVPVQGLPAMAPTVSNKTMWIGCYKDNSLMGPPTPLNFMAFPTTFPVAVDARCCLWFAFASDMAAGFPFAETLPNYRPLALTVPDCDAAENVINKASLVARTTDVWQHNPDNATRSDANGRLNTDTNLTVPAYKAAGFNSSNITSSLIRLGKIVALWDLGGPMAATTELEVGQANTLAFPAGTTPARLFLGYHDGFEWSNNSGSMIVKVSWQKA